MIYVMKILLFPMGDAYQRNYITMGRKCQGFGGFSVLRVRRGGFFSFRITVILLRAGASNKPLTPSKIPVNKPKNHKHPKENRENPQNLLTKPQ